MSERSPQVLIKDILDSIQSIQSYVEGFSYEEFMQDAKTRDAVVMHFIIIGEASSRMPERFRNTHHQIPWNEMRGLRNRVAHDYFGIDFEIVWDIIHGNLEGLSQQLHALL